MADEAERTDAVGKPSRVEGPEVRYVLVTHVRPVSVEQARLCMQKLLEMTGRLWAPGTLRMVFAAGGGRPYQAGFAIKPGAVVDGSVMAQDFLDIASVIAPWLGLGAATTTCPWEPLGPASHMLLRGEPVTDQQVHSTLALAWPLRARDKHRWTLAVDIDELVNGLTDRSPTHEEGGERAARCMITLHGAGPRRDLVANLLAEDTCGSVSLVADLIRPRQSCATALPVEFVAQLLAAPVRVPGAFTSGPALSRDALMARIAAAPSPHLLVVGATGQGKTTFLEHLIDHAASRGEPAAVVDVHDGRLTDAAAARCLEQGQDPELVDFSMTAHPVLHLTAAPPGADPVTWAAELYAIVRDLLWGDMPAEYFGPVLQRTLRASLEALIRDPSGPRPLHEMPRLLDPAEDSWRDALLARIGDPVLARTIHNEIMPMVRHADAGNTLIWLIGKLEPLIGDPYLRRVTTGRADTTQVEVATAAHRPYLLHVPTKMLGDYGSRVVVATLLHRMWLAVRRRPGPRPLHLVLDEWHRYPVPSLAAMLAEGRKFGLQLRLANQNLAQLPVALRDTVLGNIGTLACFRIGPADAAYVEGFFPTITRAQLQTLPPHHLALTTGDTDLITAAPPPLPD